MAPRTEYAKIQSQEDTGFSRNGGSDDIGERLNDQETHFRSSYGPLLLPNHHRVRSHEDDVSDSELALGSNDSNSTSLRNAWLDVCIGRTKDVVKTNVGLLLVMGSHALLSVVNVVVKQLNSIDPPVPVLELIWVRMLITWSFAIAVMFATKVEHPILGPPGIRGLLLLRGFMGFVSLFGVYFSLQYLSLSDATVLTFLTPMCTAVAGAILLKETFSRHEALAGIISLVGVVLIARPSAIFGNGAHPPAIPGVVPNEPFDDVREPTTGQRTIAVVIALLGVVGTAGAYITMRAIGKRMHPLHSLSYYSIQCVVFSTIGIFITKTEIVVPTKALWAFFLALIGVLAFCAQVLLTMGLQREAAGRGSMAIYTQIVFATILERVVFGTSPSALSIIGTLLILGSGIWILLSKERAASTRPAVGLRSVPVPSDGQLERPVAQANPSRSVEREPLLPVERV